MSKICLRIFIVIATAGAVIPAWATNYEVGSCIPKLPQFTTINAAVAAAPASSTILICPGVYPEQVVISKPLTLRGQSINNMDRPVIAVPTSNPAGPPLARNVTSAVYPSTSFAAQVLVQNGKVELLNLTVDGAGGNLGCADSLNIVGIFYASGTSGAIQGITTRNQINAGCGYGIWIENATPPNQTINISTSSVHDFDSQGITALGTQVPSLLTTTIQNNFVNGNSGVANISATGIAGTITHNVVTGGVIGILDSEFSAPTPGVTISYNDLADIQFSAGIGILVREGSTATENRISNVAKGLYLVGGASPNPGPTVTSNWLKNTSIAVEFNCTSSSALKSNTINDSATAYDKAPSVFASAPSPDHLFNIDTINANVCP